MNNDQINQALIKNLNQRLNFPNFKEMGREKTSEFIIQNDLSFSTQVAENAQMKVLNERNMIELELWAKELYLKHHDSLNRCVMDNPSSTILIKSLVE